MSLGMSNELMKELEETVGENKKKAEHAKYMTILGVLLIILTPFSVHGVIAVAVVFAGTALIIYGITTGKKIKGNTKEKLAEKMIPGILESILGEVTYQPKEGYTEQILKEAETGYAFNSIYENDLIKGCYHDVPFEFCDVELDDVHHTTDEDGRDSTSTTVSFKGQWFVFHMGRTFTDDIHIEERKWSLKKHRKNEVSTGNQEFDDKFRVLTEDENQVQFVLTPEFMKALLNIKRFEKGTVKVRFIREGRIHLLIDSRKDLLEIKSMKKVNLEDIYQKFVDEVSSIYETVAELSLDQNIR